MKSPKVKGIGEVVTEYGAKVMKIFKKGLLQRSLFDFYGDVKANAIRVKESSSVPQTPVDNDGGVVYVKNSDGKLYYKSNEVSEVEISASDTVLTTEQVQDIAGALVATGGTKTGIAVTYQDDTGDVDFVVDHDAATNFVAEEHYRWDNDIQSTATINHLNLSSDTPVETEVLVMNDGDAVWGHGEKIHIQVRNDEGSTIPAGAPLYSRGEIGGSNRILVGVCDADDSAKMPCIGIAEAEMNTTSTKDNFAITQGVYNTNISGFTGLAVGDTLYVDTSGSAPHLTKTKPTGESSLIQNVGIVLKTNGSICQGLQVSAIGRTNDVPNLNSGYIFYGNGSNQAVSTQLSTLLPADLTVDGAGTIHANNVPTLNQDTTGNAATATTAQGITGATDGDVEITSDGEVTIKLDSDNDETNQKFKVVNNSGTERFSINESGVATFTGDITVNEKITNTGTNNDLTLETDGSMTFVIDRDNDETSQSFSFKNFNVEVANLDESGNLQIDGDLTVTGNDIKDSGGNSIISSDGSGVVTMAGGNISIGGSNANLEMNSGSDIILEADNNGGGNVSTIQYPDSGGTNRIILGADSDVAILSNRAANGTVQIRANTSTAGGSGEVTVVTVEDDKVTISQDLDVTGLTTSKQRHLLRCGFYGNASRMYLPFNYGGVFESTSTAGYSEYGAVIMPCDGYVESVIIRSEQACGNSIVTVLVASDGTEVPTLSPGSFSSPTVNMAADDTSYKFTGFVNISGTTNSFSAGDVIMIAFDPTSSSYDTTATAVLVFDWNNQL